MRKLSLLYNLLEKGQLVRSVQGEFGLYISQNFKAFLFHYLGQQGV